MAGLTVGLGALALTAGCSLPAVDAQTTTTSELVDDPSELTFAVVTHAQAGDQFWDFVQSGALDAGDDLGLGSVEYSGDPDGGDQATLVDNAVAQDVDGIVVSLANPDAVRGSVEAAVAAGIPVVTVNSGIDDWKPMGAFTHVGQSETIAGNTVGERLSGEDLSKVVCVIHETGNLSQEERCAAVAETFQGEVSNIQVDGTDIGAVGTTIGSTLQSDPEIDGIVTLGGQYAVAATRAVTDAGSDAQVATFDVDESVLQRVKSGRLLFAVDQQPYLQGYLAIDALYLRAVKGQTVGGGQPVYTGPTIIDRDNVDAALASLGG